MCSAPKITIPAPPPMPKIPEAPKTPETLFSKTAGMMHNYQMGGMNQSGKVMNKMAKYGLNQYKMANYA